MEFVTTESVLNNKEGKITHRRVKFKIQTCGAAFLPGSRWLNLSGKRFDNKYCSK